MIFVADWISQICEASHIFKSVTPLVTWHRSLLKYHLFEEFHSDDPKYTCNFCHLFEEFHSDDPKYTCNFCLWPHTTPCTSVSFSALLPFLLYLPLFERLFNKFCYLIRLFNFLSLLTKCTKMWVSWGQELLSVVLAPYCIQSTQNSTWHIAGIW